MSVAPHTTKQSNTTHSAIREHGTAVPARSAQFDCVTVVGDAVVGASVTGMVSSHAMATPAATFIELEVKRMNMLPDVALWTGGMAVPLNEPLSVPDEDVPS